MLHIKLNFLISMCLPLGVVTLYCHYCYFTLDLLRSPEDDDHGCIDPKAEERSSRAIFTRFCSATETSCQFRTTYRQGLFHSLSRDCGSPCNAEYNCISKGFGINDEICTYCCNTSLCNVRTIPDVMKVPLANNTRFSIFG